MRRRIFLFLLVLASGECATVLFLPATLTTPAQRLVFLGWVPVAAWLTEIVPLGVAALSIPVLGVVGGLVTPKAAFKPFADPFIFLFLGSFLVARAVEKSHIPQWLVRIISRMPCLSRNLYSYSFAVMGVPFSLSMWLSNTATTAALLPLVPALAGSVPQRDRPLLSKAFLLGIAYAASIGGIATPVGTPPNLIALAHARQAGNIPLASFTGWIVRALPLSLMMLVMAHFWLYRDYLRRLPWQPPRDPVPVRLDRDDKAILTIFMVMVAAWFGPGIVRAGFPHSTLSQWLVNHWHDAIPPLVAALALYLIPGRKGVPLLLLDDLHHIDWSTLLLFGGGLSLGTMAHQVALFDQLLGHEPFGSGLPAWLPAAGLTITAVFTTELFSNTAMANILVPVAVGMFTTGLTPDFSPLFTVALGCSMAFMLPVATPPNAIVFGSRQLTLRDMMRSGWRLNIVASTLLTLYLMLVM